MKNKLSKRTFVLVVVLSIIIIGLLILISYTIINRSRTHDSDLDEKEDVLLDIPVQMVEAPPEIPVVDVSSIWEQLDGYYSSEDRMFLRFHTDTNRVMLTYGLLQSSFAVEGELIDIGFESEDSYIITLNIAATEETLMNDAVAEHTEVVYLKLSQMIKSEDILFKSESIGEAEWHTYTKINEADIFNQSEPAYSVHETFEMLEGYWFTEHGQRFFGFFTQDDSCVIVMGMFQIEYSDVGEMTVCESTGRYTFDLLVHFPATDEEDIDGHYEEYTERIQLNMSSFDRDETNVLLVMVDSFSDNDWVMLVYGGPSYDEAYEQWQQLNGQLPV
ncbi:MAG: hypothetical protein FWG21_02195 [Oscillospiraceae bacterium]|nr:hypothetical protein [Oscillospiraceae bacterium]